MSKIFKIIKVGDPILHKKTKKVKNFTKIDKFINKLHKTLLEYKALGIASNQVGIDKSLCIIDIPNYNYEWYEGALLNGNIVKFKDLFPLVLINPEVTLMLESPITTQNEGCLSIPNKFYSVTRYDHIKVKYQDKHGNNNELQCRSILSRVIQHEVDHLNGILINEKL